LGDNSPQNCGEVMLESVTFEPKNTTDLERFFEENKDKCHEIWVVLKKETVANPQPMSFDQALKEAKKQGLIDSRTKTIDTKKYGVRFTKRIKKSSV
jgi:hypothetical protein